MAKQFQTFFFHVRGTSAGAVRSRLPGLRFEAIYRCELSNPLPPLNPPPPLPSPPLRPSGSFFYPSFTLGHSSPRSPHSPDSWLAFLARRVGVYEIFSPILAPSNSLSSVSRSRPTRRRLLLTVSRSGFTVFLGRSRVVHALGNRRTDPVRRALHDNQRPTTSGWRASRP